MNADVCPQAGGLKSTCLSTKIVKISYSKRGAVMCKQDFATGLIARGKCVGGAGGLFVVDAIDSGAVVVVDVEFAGLFAAVGFAFFVRAIAMGEILAQATVADPCGFFLGFEFDWASAFEADESCHGETPEWGVESMEKPK